MCHPSFEKVQDGVTEALRRFYRNDLYLIRIKAHERSLTFRLGMYLQQIFPDWDVDCEYNRNVSEPDDVKRIPGHKPVYPDVILHKRGSAKNLLAIEAKPPHSSSGAIGKDKRKIEKYVTRRKLRYRFGLFIEFKEDFESTAASLLWCQSEEGTPRWFGNDGKSKSVIGFEER